jgi:hypothetical protein
MDRPLHPITAIRRLPLRLCLLLPLLLALTQHGAWLHELSHVAYAATAHQVSVGDCAGTLENGACAGCQSFGQLGTALSASLATLPTPLGHLCPQAAPQYSSPAAQRPALHNRGPPLLA